MNYRYLLQWTEPEQIGPDDWHENKCYRLCSNKHHMMNKIEKLISEGIINIIVSKVNNDFEIENIQ